MSVTSRMQLLAVLAVAAASCCVAADALHAPRRIQGWKRVGATTAAALPLLQPQQQRSLAMLQVDFVRFPQPQQSKDPESLIPPVYDLVVTPLTNQTVPGAGDGSGGPTCLAHGSTEAISMAGYTWISNARTRRNARTNFGDPSRLRAAIDRFKKGEQLTVTFVGGSISAGHGATHDGKGYVEWVGDILSAALGPRAKVHNAAAPGTMSSYMSACHNMHVPKETDIVFVEYTVNDDYAVSPAMDNPVRRPYERLLRQLLNYPRRPAVILLHSFTWHHLNIPSGLYWASCERDFHEFAIYYGLAELSVKNTAWRLMKDGVHGFMVDQTRSDRSGARRPPEEDAALKGRVFYWDVIHPDGLTGHKFMAEVVVQSILDAVAGVEHESVTEVERASIKYELLPPMLPHNWQSASDRCFVGAGFQPVVFDHGGWEFKDESKDPSKPKLGFVSHQPGNKLRMKLNTMTQATNKQNMQVTVELSYLRSHKGMGRAAVTCESGCTCERTQLDGHHDEHNSQLYLHEFKVTQHEACIIAVQVLPDSHTPNQHKVKLAGVVVSEEGIKNHLAVAATSGHDKQ